MAEYFYRKNLVQRILYERRRRRVEFILSKVNVFPGMSVLDVGCGPDGRSLENFLPSDFIIVGIDLHERKYVRIDHPGFSYIQQDASDLGIFVDKQFDLTFSIGMMEHICNRSILNKMAREIERVSKQYVIIVPWKWAWLEPHFKFPFFQLLPYSLKLFLTKLLNLHGLREKVQNEPTHIKNHYSWLPSEEWKKIFVGSSVYLCPTLETIAIVKHDTARCSKTSAI